MKNNNNKFVWRRSNYSIN